MATALLLYNIDVVAAMTNVRTTCNDSGEKVFATANFDVLGRAYYLEAKWSFGKGK